MIDISQPAALPDGDCTFAAVACPRDERVDIRALRRAFSPRIAVLADASTVVVVARFTAPVPPRRAIGIALSIEDVLFNRFGLFASHVAPLSVLPPIRMTMMDRYRIDLSTVGPLDVPVAPLPRDYTIPRIGGCPLIVISAGQATTGGAA